MILPFNSGKKKILEHGIVQNIGNSSNLDIHHLHFQGRYESKSREFPYFNLESLQAATNNFGDSNKLGQGGFGPVYKVIAFLRAHLEKFIFNLLTYVQFLKLYFYRYNCIFVSFIFKHDLSQ